MAISFLDNINLNNNEIQNVIIQRLGSDPTGIEGKIIYNNGSKTIKYFNGTDWVELDGLGGLQGSGTVGTVPVFVTNTTTLGDSQLITSGSGVNQTFTFNTSGDTNFKGDIVSTGNLFLNNISGKGGLKDKDGDLGSAGQLLSSTGTATDWINAPVSYSKWIAQNTAAAAVNDGDTYVLSEDTTNPGIRQGAATKSGTFVTLPLSLSVKSMTTASPSDFATDTLLWSDDDGSSSWKVQKSHIEDIPVSAWGDATSTVDMGSQKIIDLADPTAAQDAATKAYVDSSVEGGLTVKGGFNAATGAITTGGNLTVGGARVAVAIGDYYVVTVAGNFFTNAATPLTIGDSVLVQTAAAAGASVEGDFAVIQSDTDLATIGTVGIGNVNIESTGLKDGLSLSYTSGTAKLGLDITSLPAEVLNTTCVAAFADPDDTNSNIKATVPAIAASLNAITSKKLTTTSQTTHTFTHNLNTFNVIVQLYDSSSLQTVYASVDRTSVDVVTATTASSASLTALITKIG